MTIVETKPNVTGVVDSEADREAHHLFGHPLPQCPRCGAQELETIVEDVFQDVYFYCRTCERCWRVELGFAQPFARSVCYRRAGEPASGRS